MSRYASLVLACPQCGRLGEWPCWRHGPDQQPVVMDLDDAEELWQAYAELERHRGPED